MCLLEQDTVNAHVGQLKSQNWQAFQVRFEVEDLEWVFVHGKGVKEVESMSEVVKDIEGNKQKEAFLKAVGVK